MASPLDISVRKLGLEYHREPINEFLGWAPDYDDNTRPHGAASEMLNLRLERPDVAEIRSGVRRNLQLPGQKIPLARAEYHAGGRQYDVTVFYEGTQLFVVMYEKLTQFSKIIPIAVCVPSIKACAKQFNSYLIVSAKTDTPLDGIGTWALWPQYSDSLKLADPALPWNVEQLGKEVCPTPDVFTFADTTKGDLFVFDSKNNGGVMELQYDPSDPIPRRIPVALNTTYYIATNPAILSTNLAKRWVWADQDVPVQFPTSAVFHIESRGWYYRYVAICERVDANGQNVRFRSNPSTDMFVPDRIYTPPFPFNDAGFVSTTPIYENKDQNDPNHYFGENDGSFNAHSWDDLFPAGGLAPTATAMAQLALDWRAYWNVSTNWRTGNSDAGTTDPFYFTALYMGWMTGDSANLRRYPPYRVEVPASELKHAPLTVLNYSDFKNLPAGTVAIELYRTAHSQPNEKDNPAKDPLFTPHQYGYVATMKPGESFTDDVPDQTVIATGAFASDFEGFLKSQQSGEVLGVYQNQLVLGNTESVYWVLKPDRHVQGFAFAAPTGSVDAYGFGADIIAPGGSLAVDPDEYGGTRFKTSFHYTYIDSENNESDPTEIIINRSATAGSLWIAFRFPRGYSSFIVSIRIYRGVWNGTSRDYFPIATVPVEIGEYISKNDESVGAPQALPTKTVHSDIDPGALLWTRPNQPWFWPKLNFELRHQWSPIRGMSTLAGPLWVWTEEDSSLTELNGKAEVTGHIGCIARHGFATYGVDKIVFYLSHSGLYFAEASGPEPMVGTVHTEVLKYLREEIPEVAPLANARRASLGWNAQRRELYLHFPSSIDFGGHLPHRTFVYKFPDVVHPSRVKNYEFDLRSDFEVKDVEGSFSSRSGSRPPDVTTYKPWPVLFLSHSDGDIYASLLDLDAVALDGTEQALELNDLDVPTLKWAGKTVLEFRWAMKAPLQTKFGRELQWRAKALCDMTLEIGESKFDQERDHTTGSVNAAAAIWPVSVRGSGATEIFRHIISGPVIETQYAVPVTRLVTVPNFQGNHMVAYSGLLFDVEVAHNHPI